MKHLYFMINHLLIPSSSSPHFYDLKHENLCMNSQHYTTTRISACT